MHFTLQLLDLADSKVFFLHCCHRLRTAQNHGATSLNASTALAFSMAQGYVRKTSSCSAPPVPTSSGKGVQIGINSFVLLFRSSGLRREDFEWCLSQEIQI